MAISDWSPNKIERQHVREAAKIWDKDGGFLNFRQSLIYDVIIGRKHYPPKAISSIAHKLATGRAPHPNDFAGAKDGRWHKRLSEDLGFSIVKKIDNKGHLPPGRQRMLKLRKYFNEYSGEGRTKGHGGGKRTVKHGAIVKALEALLSRAGDSQKAQAIDLAVVSSQRVYLFEVKTSARTTDVYTGVGQLLIHGECISELLGLPVRRYLVLPDRPSKAHEPHIVRKGGMCIVTFQKVKGGYCFTGIRTTKS